MPTDQAPKTWEDALDPKWTDAITVKVSNSGLQHVAWFELRRIYGADYWKKFAELKPRAFDSYVQQYDRLVNQQDKIIHTAQYSGYLEWKAKGAPVAFVAPADGLPAPRQGPRAGGMPPWRQARACLARYSATAAPAGASVPLGPVASAWMSSR